MATVQHKLVHKQFNSPLGLYSEQNIKESMDRELKAYGAQGIAVAEPVNKPLGNLANSAVLRAVEEEEQEMKCENIKTCQRQSRSKQRYPQQQKQQQQRPLTLLHQQQLEQIKTEFLNQQHDVTIDRDTVLKINRLATRRNLHKREHSWPPTTTSGDSCSDYGNESDGGGCGGGGGGSSGGSHHVGNRTSGFERQQPQQHVRSSSHDNTIQFDNSVCKRHSIDAIRRKFNSPTRIIEPTVGELRLLRQRQQKPSDRKQTATAEKQALRKNDRNKSTNMTNVASARKTNPETMKNTNFKKCDTPSLQSAVNDERNRKSQTEVHEVQYITTLPLEKGFSCPETKAADLDIGLVEPKRQYFERLASSKRWHSFENVSTALGEITKQEKPAKRVPSSIHKRQSYSLERGRNTKSNKQLHLPPQKPRAIINEGDHLSSKLQRRAIQLATEIKISYDLDADEHNIQVMTRDQPDAGFNEDEIEGLPLPPTPELKTQHLEPTNVKQGNEKNSAKSTFHESLMKSPESVKDITIPQMYDDSCIYLRSIDFEDNTVAYIPAAITIVPSPTEEIMQYWKEPNKLKATIKDFVENENLMSVAEKKSAKATPEATKQRNDKLQSDSNTEEPKTYVTRLPSTPTGIQLTRQTSINNKSKGKSHLNDDSNCNDNKQNIITTMTSTLASKPTTQITQETPNSIHTFQSEIERQQQLTKKHNTQKDVTTQQESTGVYYTDGDYLYGPFRSSSTSSLADVSVRPLCVAKGDESPQMDLNIIQEKTDAETNYHKQDNKNGIATLAAKYEHIQQSITEHLKQIDSYIENAKIALKSSTSQALQPKDIALWPHKENVNIIGGGEKQNIESPLKEVLRKLSYIMTEVQPHHGLLSHNEEERRYVQNIPTENLPVVDKVLMDLAKLATHLRRYETTDDITSIKAILDELQAKHCFTSNKSLHMHNNVESSPAIVQHATTENEEILDKAIKEMSNQMRLDDEKLTQGNNCRITQTQSSNKKLSNQSAASSQNVVHVERSVTPVPAPPPPPPPFPFISNAIHLNKRKPENVCDVVASYEQLSATGKIITPDTPAQPLATLTSTNQQSHPCQLEQHQQHLQQQNLHSVLQLTPKENRKNLVSGFIATQRHQQQLVDQVIDIVDKAAALENVSSSEVNVNEHSTTSATTSPVSVTISSATFNEKDVAITQKCIISDSTNAQTSSIEKKNDERHTISDSANNIMSNEQFPNDNDKHSSHAINYLKDHRSKSEAQQQNKSNLTFHPSQPVADTDSDKQVETYKASYEVRSPYVTRRQISWEDIKMQQASNTATITAHIPHSDNETQMTSPHTTNHKYSMFMLEKNKKTPETVFASEPTASTTSSHVKMQSTMPLKPRTQSKQECSDMMVTKEQQSPTPVRKYPAALIEPHVPMRATPLFGMNANENLKECMARTSSVSPVRSNSPKSDYGSSTVIGGESLSQPRASLLQPHTTRRTTSPFELNSLNTTNRSGTSLTHREVAGSDLVKPWDEMTSKFSISLTHSNSPARSRTPYNLNSQNVTKNEEELDTSSKMFQKDDNNSYDDDRDDDYTKPHSPIRKYPQPLIEPHLPTRAASPFGLNVIEPTHRERTPSPARANAKNRYKHADSTDDIKLTYVPQLEGHNVGLLVRTTIEAIPTSPAARYRKQHETKTAVTLADSSTDLSSPHSCPFNKQKSYHEKSNIDIDSADAYNDAYDDLQNMNAVGTSRREIPSDMNDSFTNSTNATAVTCDGSNREMITSAQQQQQQYFKHHANELSSPLPTVINRSFDNVSPRPYISIEGYKRVAWPPVSEERIVREFTPQPQPQYQTVPPNNQQQQQQQQLQQQQPHQQLQSYPSAAVSSTQQQYRAPSYETHQQFQNPIQPQYSPLARSNQNQYQQPSQFEQQQQYQQPPWMQSQQRQFQPQPQPYQAPQYQPPLNQYQTISIQSQPNQFTTQTNQSYNFNSQPQQQLQQQTVPPHDQTDHRHLQQQQPLSQDYRSSSPGVITLRKEAPLSQRPTPVYISQPAANILKGGSNMRGDLKWPPPEYKEAAARENEERRQIAKGPAFRPRKTHRDYSAFFAKNALSHHYPSYKVPPGTQHIMAK